MIAVDCRSDLDEVFRSQARALLYRILNWLLLLVFGRSLARPACVACCLFGDVTGSAQDLREPLQA